ncbi:20957_t:CDS:2 [Gigaspora margarita]|uniref:20957_t:CDS:1 n=1 Tax=Gigaspora margarita TaxID=4874 RepID=A0ABM8W5U0_GIGMA|nr:20957_t:CDS:2 [Gigaspora margarita]
MFTKSTQRRVRKWKEFEELEVKYRRQKETLHTDFLKHETLNKFRERGLRL